MKKNITLFLILLSNSLIMGQAAIEAEDASESYKTPVYTINQPKVLSVQGHRYFEEGNKLATIYTHGKKAVKCLVRYNSFSDEIEITEIYKILKEDYVEVVLDREKYSYKVFEHDGQKHFFILFNKGETSLVLKTFKRIKQGQKAIRSYDENIPDKYVARNEYFIKKSKKDNLVPLKLKKKEILKILEDKKDRVEKFASSEKLNFKKEEDVIRIINYYNSI